ncbi:hypothetical protein [Sphingobacterium sp. LRF_L2]|uniref:hypothetical protein n=1 Tax=Sphingobacterium sp. LRF_L2 TaxID=3369421 RepID=UPI003F607701
MKRGFKEAQGLVWLDKDDVWKFGTSKDLEKRYTQKYKNSIGEHGVYIDSEFSGNLSNALSVESMKILNFKVQTGYLTPGNKIVK